MTNQSDKPGDEDVIEAMAADWLVEQEGGFAAGRADAFARWRGSDPRHRAAVARLEAAHLLLQRLPGLRDDDRLARRVEQMIPPKRARLIPFPYVSIAAAAAALAIAATLWSMRSPRDFRQEYATADGGATMVTLPDSSRVQLGGNSVAAVNYSARRREVELTRGEANFSVARDPARPFVVAAGKVRILAVGTIFTVRYGVASVDVAVLEGKVQVSRRESAEVNTPVSDLVAGQSLEVRTGETGITDRGPPPGSAVPAASGLNNRLVFNGTPLSRVIEEFNRRNRIQLVLEGDEIAGRPVGGEFEADQVEAFVRALQSTGEIGAERTDDTTIVLRKGH